MGDWRTFRMDGDALQRLASTAGSTGGDAS